MAIDNNDNLSRLHAARLERASLLADRQNLLGRLASAKSDADKKKISQLLRGLEIKLSAVNANIQNLSDYVSIRVRAAEQLSASGSPVAQDRRQAALPELIRVARAASKYYANGCRGSRLRLQDALEALDCRWPGWTAE